MKTGRYLHNSIRSFHICRRRWKNPLYLKEKNFELQDSVNIVKKIFNEDPDDKSVKIHLSIATKYNFVFPNACKNQTGCGQTHDIA